ncbi:MAG: acetylornithine deacetylase [Pseudomonadota bacterium]
MPQTFTPREMLARLVAFPTVSRDSNLPLIDFVESYLAEHGIASTRLPDETGEKASLYATVGPATAGGTILSGHTDVVPVDGQAWMTDPWTLTEREGRLYGRGTCDMKGFCATALALVPQMLSADLKRPVQIALSYDEEVGCLGAPPMIAHMRAHTPPAATAIIGEPTMMQVVNGHKGIWGLMTHVEGFEVHSSLVHTGVSAVMTAARLIGWLDGQMAANKAAWINHPERIAYDPPYTTLHVGRIEGGTAHNITARRCAFSTDIRVIPGEDLDMWFDRYIAEVKRVEAEIRAVRPEASITVDVISRTPGCQPEQDGAAETLARQMTGDNGQHKVAYATEAGQFQEGGYSAVICGPGSIEQAHQPNEYITVDQLDAGEAFLRRVIDRMAA